MDTLLILKRPIKVTKPDKKNKLTRSKSRKLWPSPVVKVAKNTGEGPLRNKSSCETMVENPRPSSETEHVSFVSLYHDLCCEYYGGSDLELPPSGIVTVVGAGAGDYARRARVHVVLEIDY